jgi:hypothetical protein
MLAAVAVFYAGPVMEELKRGIKEEFAKREKAGKRLTDPQETFPKGSKEQSRDQIGKLFNVNGRYKEFCSGNIS